MKQRKTLNLVIAIICLLGFILMFWETLLVGFNARTILAIVSLIAGIVLLRRWYQGD
jgi:membrane-bound ClpP family serine protease